MKKGQSKKNDDFENEIEVVDDSVVELTTVNDDAGSRLQATTDLLHFDTK